MFNDYNVIVFNSTTGTNISEYDESNRRGSNGQLVPISPDTELLSKTSPNVGEGGEQDTFYLLKKESQRRTTLNKVLVQDEKRIVDVWTRNCERDVEGIILKRVQERMIFIVSVFFF